MAITVQDIQEAVDRLLPRTLDVSRDPDSGQLEREKVVERALQIVRTSVLFDTEASIHALSLAVQEWTSDLSSLVDSFDLLISNDLLLTLTADAPHYVEDLTKLLQARTQLSQLSGSVSVLGHLSQDYLTDFKSSLDGFISEDIAPNVQDRNRAVIQSEAKALFASIESQWASMLDKKSSLVAKVTEFAAVDLKAATSAEAISASRQKLNETIDFLQSATASDQASASEQILVDLAAIRAVLSIIDSASSPEGETQVGPASDGRTPSDYLQRSGIAHPEPPAVVQLPSGELHRNTGLIHLSDKVITAGYAVPEDDGDGDNATPYITDLSADFVSDGVAENNFVACAATGLNHRILSIESATKLKVTPEIPTSLGPDNRYLVLEDLLGTFFKDENESFWTLYEDGESGSNEVVSGSGGVFRTDKRLEFTGSGGFEPKNYKERGTAGDWWPSKLVDNDAQLGGSTAPDRARYGAYIGDSTSKHTQSTGTASISVLHRLSDSSVADFTLLGLASGDLLYIDAVDPDDRWWRISVITSAYIQLDTTAKTPTTTMSGRSWQVRDTSSSSVVYHPTGNFVAAGLAADDHIGLRSALASYRTMTTIVNVISEYHVEIADTGLATVYNDAIVFCWQDSASLNTTLLGPDYLHTDDVLYGYQVQVGDTVRIASGGGGIEGDYTIESIISGNVVKLEEAFGDYVANVVAYYHDPDYQRLFRDEAASFLVNGIEAGDRIYMEVGTGTGTPVAGGETDWTVDSVSSNTVLRLTAPMPRGMEQAHWHASPNHEFFYNTGGMLVYEGMLKDELAEDPGYELVIGSGAFAGSYDLAYTPSNPSQYPEIGPYWLRLDDTLANGAGDRATFTNVYIAPKDDKTWLFGFDEAYGSKIDFLDFTDNAGDSNSVGALMTFDGSRDVAYLIVGAESYPIVYAVREDPTDLTSPAYTIRIPSRVDVLESPTFDWAIWRGLTTEVFKDTVNAPFADSSVGDVIRVDPNGPAQQDLVILEVISNSEVRIGPPIDAGQTGLSYALFNSVKPGMELVTTGRRSLILDIDSEHVLRLEKPLPMSAGTGLDWFVVRPGLDLTVTYVSDRSPAFIARGGFGNPSDGAHDWVEGSEIHFTGQRTAKAKIVAAVDRDDDDVYETLLTTLPVDMSRGALSYRILDFDERRTKKFGSVSNDLSGVEVGDLLTVWGQDGVFEVEAVVGGELEVTPRLPSSLFDQHFVVVRGGTVSWGRYLLLDYLLDLISLEDDLELLKLRLAEVVADFGDISIESVTSGVTPTWVEDGDEDDQTPILRIAKNVDVAPADRVQLVVDGVAQHSYIASVDNSDAAHTDLTLYREFGQSTSVSVYTVDKNSVSYVISDALDRRDEVQALIDVTQEFSIPEAPSVALSRTLMTELGLDRARDLMEAGDLAAVVGMDEAEASYSDVAKSAVNTAGQNIDPAGTSTGTSTTAGYAAGVDPATGTRYPGGDAGGLTSSTVSVAGEVETKIALARMSEWLIADERTHQAFNLSLDELRSRRIYELIGQVDSDLVIDSDPTLPWIDQTGSTKDRLIEIEEEAVAALDYIIANPDNFEDVEGS